MGKKVRKVEGKPLHINEDSTLHIKPEKDGKVKITRVDNVGDSRKAHKEMQKRCKSGSKDWKNLENNGKRLIATMPEQAHNEMKKKCGDDPEKQERFLKDHPEYLTSKQVKQDLGKGKNRKVITHK